MTKQEIAPIKPLLPCPYCRAFLILAIDRPDASARGCLKCNRWIRPPRRTRERDKALARLAAAKAVAGDEP